MFSFPNALEMILMIDKCFNDILRLRMNLSCVIDPTIAVSSTIDVNNIIGFVPAIDIDDCLKTLPNARAIETIGIAITNHYIPIGIDKFLVRDILRPVVINPTILVDLIVLPGLKILVNVLHLAYRKLLTPLKKFII